MALGELHELERPARVVVFGPERLERLLDLVLVERLVGAGDLTGRERGIGGEEHRLHDLADVQASTPSSAMGSGSVSGTASSSPSSRR